MYTRFFGLSEKPFAITPDPRYLFLSERHAEALAHLLYGINESGGFIQLTGEVGTGKTTVVRTLLSRLPQHADVAVIMNPRISPAEFLLTICEELGVAVAEADRDSVKQMVDALNRHLLSAHAEGKRVIVIVDEAQNLSAEVLEQVRLLTNLETPTQKLLQIILIGQPELRDLLDRTDLRQLAQRITGRYHLSPLSREESVAYVRHRLRVAGAAGEIFTDAALNEVFRLSAGVPRVINVCCDRALLGAYTQETRRITPALVRRAAGEVYGRHFASRWLAWLARTAGAAVLLAVLVTVGRYGSPAWTSLRAARGQSAPPRSAAAAAAPSEPADAGIASGAVLRRPGAATHDDSASFDSLLAQKSAPVSEVAAFRRLLALWGTAMTEDRDPCAQAARAGLACLEQHGSWAQVRMLNRPAVLTLTDERGRRMFVVLTALTDRTATLAWGDREVQVPVDELSRLWFGEFTVVWKPKTPRARLLTVGMSGDEVRWLRRSLNALRGASADAARGDVYDNDLAVAVQNFQREHRLNVDGVAGLQTQVVIDTALAEPGSPLLLPAPARGG
jgi:general secretion pathway protein A